MNFVQSTDFQDIPVTATLLEKLVVYSIELSRLLRSIRNLVT
jgi:hypothetical protein